MEQRSGSHGVPECSCGPSTAWNFPSACGGVLAGGGSRSGARVLSGGSRGSRGEAEAGGGSVASFAPRVVPVRGSGGAWGLFASRRMSGAGVISIGGVETGFGVLPTLR